MNKSFTDFTIETHDTNTSKYSPVLHRPWSCLEEMAKYHAWKAFLNHEAPLKHKLHYAIKHHFLAFIEYYNHYTTKQRRWLVRFACRYNRLELVQTYAKTILDWQEGYIATIAHNVAQRICLVSNTITNTITTNKTILDTIISTSNNNIQDIANYCGKFIHELNNTRNPQYQSLLHALYADSNDDIKAFRYPNRFKEPIKVLFETIDSVDALKTFLRSYGGKIHNKHLLYLIYTIQEYKSHSMLDIESLQGTICKYIDIKNTELELACILGDLEWVKRTSKKDTDKVLSALKYAIKLHHNHILDYFVSNGHHVSNNYASVLEVAIKKNNVQALHTLLPKRTRDVNLFRTCIKYNNLQCYSILCKLLDNKRTSCDFEFDSQDDDNEHDDDDDKLAELETIGNLFEFACECGCEYYVERYIQTRTRKNDTEMISAFTQACTHGHVTIVSLLLEAYADAMSTQFFDYLFHVAAKHGHANIMCQVNQKQALLYGKIKTKTTSLPPIPYFALFDTQYLHALRVRGKKYLELALQCAFRVQNEQAIQTCVQYGANDFNSALECSVHTNNKKQIQYLIKQGASNVNSVFKEWLYQVSKLNPPLEESILKDMVLFYLDCGADNYESIMCLLLGIRKRYYPHVIMDLANVIVAKDKIQNTVQLFVFCNIQESHWVEWFLEQHADNVYDFVQQVKSKSNKAASIIMEALNMSKTVQAILVKHTAQDYPHYDALLTLVNKKKK
jgi:ankyrin repeat protein